MTFHTPGRVHEVFSAVLERPRAERAESLRQLCAGDAALQSEIERLLETYEQLEPDGAPAADDLVGTTIGAYQVLRVLGAGGMGQVYLGTRVDGTFNRDVAIKVVQSGQMDSDTIARFEDECRILATLHHPSIASLFDAGRLPDGRLFIVMEYVDGLPITTYCDQRALTIRERLVLFDRVCGAVAEAHRNLIIHRDLKPGNVLVTADGVPKLLDFGIAKALTRAGVEAGPPTDPMLRRATPAYASPEQLAGEPTTTGMDVFALGVILYELLTGVLPRGEAPDAVTRSDGAPYEAPSRLRSTVSAGLVVDAELDATVLMAIDRADRRYRSVDALIADVRAYAANRPVAAFDGSRAYHARKYLSRNRALAAATAVAVLALIAGIAGLLRAVRAERREHAVFAERLAAAGTLADSLFQVDQSLATATGAMVGREKLVRSLTDYLDRIRQQAGSDRQLRLEISQSYRRIGDIEANPNGPNLGDRHRALAAYTAAADVLRGLAGETADPAVSYELALTHAGTGDVLAAQGAADDARRAYAEARAAADSLARAHSDDMRYDALAAGIERSVGDLELSQKRPDAALASYERANGIEVALAARTGDSIERRRFRALTLVRIASAQADRGAWGEARRDYRDALDLLRQLSDSGAPAPGLMRDTALALSRLARSMHPTDEQGALEAARQAVDILKPIARADPADARAQHDLLEALLQYGDLQRSGDRDTAQVAYRDALSIAESLNRPPLADAQSAADLALVNDRLGQDPAVAPPELSLAAVVDGRKIPIVPDRDVPDSATAIVVAGHGPRGWRQYLIVFGASGEPAIFDEQQLADVHWTVPLGGPPPAETVLLVAVPRPLTDAERHQLASGIASVSGPRAIDWNAQVIWRSDADERIVSRFTARGRPNTDWMKDVRAHLDALHGALFSGRTFPFRPVR